MSIKLLCKLIKKIKIIMWILVLMAVNVSSIIAGLIAGKEIKVFLKKYKNIADEYVLEEFKSMVRHQMYMVYFLLFFNFISLFLSIVVVVNHGFIGLIVALVTNTFNFCQSQYFRKLKNKAMSLDAANEFLARRYYQISDAWVNKPLPDL